MTKEKIPELHAAISRAKKQLDELEMFVDICANALDKSTQVVQTIDVTQRLAKQANLSEHIMTEEELVRIREKAGEVEVFARQQKEDGFTYLFGLAIIRLCSILEALVYDLVVDFISRPEECKDKDLIYGLKGPLLEFATASPEQQADFLAERLKDAVNAGLKPGIGRFESMLEPIGLGGGIDPDVRRVLFELSQVRNAIVHKGGITDKRFAKSCQWLNIKVGKPLKINSQNFFMYRVAVYCYAVELRLRIIGFLGQEKPQEFINLLRESGDLIRELWANRIEKGDA
jgi:hypothetical protein